MSATARGSSFGRSATIVFPGDATLHGGHGVNHGIAQVDVLGSQGEHSEVDAGRIEKIAGEAPHAVDLLVDEPNELERLGRVARVR